MSNLITETVRSFYEKELKAYDYSYKETKEEFPTFWVAPGSTLSKRIKASVVIFVKAGKMIAIIVPPTGNDIRIEIDYRKKDEKLFITTEFSDSGDLAEQLKKDLKKELTKAEFWFSF